MVRFRRTSDGESIAERGEEGKEATVRMLTCAKIYGNLRVEVLAKGSSGTQQ